MPRGRKVSSLSAGGRYCLVSCCFCSFWPDSYAKTPSIGIAEAALIGVLNAKNLVLPVLAYLVDSAVRSFAPKGLRISAQGCCAAATLGKGGTHKDPTPTGLRKGGQGWQ